MYCSSCGAAVLENLSYCNQCGARLSNAKALDAKAAAAASENLMWAIVAVALGGLGIILALVAVLKGLKVSDGAVILMTLLSFLIVLGAEAMLLWMLWRHKNSAQGQSAAAQPKDLTTKELDAAQEARFLGETPAPTSITEHTTRTLEPIYNKRKTE